MKNAIKRLFFSSLYIINYTFYIQKMKATYLFLIVVILTSCGGKEDNSLAGKKAQLSEFKTQAKDLTQA
jgi:hypothetical protein